MNRKQLEYFIEAYRCRIIQMAANHLYITHQGLSRVIRSLDDPNNGQMMYLVERYSTPPTRAGRCFKTYLLEWIRDHRSQLTEQTSQF